MMCSHEFCAGMLLGAAVGTCVGIQMKAKERKLRRVICRTARNMENAFDSMTR